MNVKSAVVDRSAITDKSSGMYYVSLTPAMNRNTGAESQKYEQWLYFFSYETY